MSVKRSTRAWQAILPAAALVVGGALVLRARSAARVPVEIPFVARVAGAPFSCGDGAPGAAGGGTAFVGQDLRFYVHDVALVDEGGAAVPVRLDDDGVAQQGGVALVDFEDGAGRCDEGTRLVHTVLRGTVPPGKYRGLRFTLGVPFALNHADPATAAPPLDLGRMSWGWQAGYKFLRFEGVRADGTAVRVHLGSTGCSGTFGHVSGCARPNRITVELPRFVAGHDRVVVDLDRLIGRGDGRAQLCQSEPGDPACATPFAALGLDPASGAQSAPQRLFVVGS